MIEGKTQVEEKSCKKINRYKNNKMMHVSAPIVVVLEHVPLCQRNHNYFR